MVIGEQDGNDAVEVASSDLTLVRAVPSEDLYQGHYASMVRLAGLLLGDYQAGEEVAQEAFARLLKSHARMRQPAGYLRGTVLRMFVVVTTSSDAIDSSFAGWSPVTVFGAEPI
jgi:hypothetical protein